jgi:hypothetical protein
MKNKVLFIALIICAFPNRVRSQNDDKAILEPIYQLFTAMAESDSAKLHTAFASNPSLNTIVYDKNGKIFVKSDPLHGFLIAIGTPHKEICNEPIWGLTVLRDGDFAQVWANYAFFLGKTFSHCGIDAFQLIKEDGKLLT